MKKAILLIIVLLNGCAFDDFFRKKEEPQIPISQPREVRIDPRALTRCDSLVPLPSGTKDYETVLLNIRDNALIHRACVEKQDNSIKLIKELSNIKRRII